MPRHKKPRICRCPAKGKAFKPAGIPLSAIEKVLLHIDELETLKLCDLDGLTQEEAGRKMGVSRGTVQRILAVRAARQPWHCQAARPSFSKRPRALKKEDRNEVLFSHSA